MRDTLYLEHKILESKAISDVCISCYIRDSFIYSLPLILMITSPDQQSIYPINTLNIVWNILSWFKNGLIYSCVQLLRITILLVNNTNIIFLIHITIQTSISNFLHKKTFIISKNVLIVAIIIINSCWGHMSQKTRHMKPACPVFTNK